MQATETAGREPQMDFSIRENRIGEMQDVLTRYLPRFHRSAYRQLGNVADAEDAVQDALLAAYKHLDQFRGQSQMSTWLTTIVCNCTRMQLRRRPRQVRVALDETIGDKQEYSVLERLADNGRTPEDECRIYELNALVRTFAAQLSPTLRRTFQLRDVDGLSISETARILGIPSGTVKAQLARARAKLKDAIRRALEPRPRVAKHGQKVRTDPETNVTRGSVSGACIA
jgi:RNA polymerase sigma-70 factor (ECF subfamily)